MEARLEAGLLGLPCACLDHVFGKLSREELFTASLVCKTLRWLPANQLEVLVIDERLSCPPGQLQHMRCVMARSVIAWHGASAAAYQCSSRCAILSA